MEIKDIKKKVEEINWVVPDNVADKLREIYHLNFILSRFGCKQFNLAPQYTYRVKYITIDTDILHSLVKSKISKSLFGKDQLSYWQFFSNIKSKYLKDNKKFNMMIKTIGAGCSVVLFKDVIISKVKKDDSEKLQANIIDEKYFRKS